MFGADGERGLARPPGLVCPHPLRGGQCPLGLPDTGITNHQNQDYERQVLDIKGWHSVQRSHVP